jgi:hypothetical protein
MQGRTFLGMGTSNTRLAEEDTEKVVFKVGIRRYNSYEQVRHEPHYVCLKMKNDAWDIEDDEVFFSSSWPDLYILKY